METAGVSISQGSIIVTIIFKNPVPLIKLQDISNKTKNNIKENKISFTIDGTNKLIISHIKHSILSPDNLDILINKSNIIAADSDYPLVNKDESFKTYVYILIFIIIIIILSIIYSNRKKIF